MATSPTASRPYAPGYGIPTTLKGTLPWTHAQERLTAARTYWVCTARADGRPHAVPVWGVWLDDTWMSGGGPKTQWTRNLLANPAAALHLESGDDVVIVEGVVERITDVGHPMTAIFDAAYKTKYDMPHGAPFWLLRPHVAYAWHNGLANATRWRFKTS
jgi:hypothetical protein